MGRNKMSVRIIASYPVVGKHGTYKKYIMKSNLQEIRDENPRLMKALETGKFEDDKEEMK